jgi:glycerophosphoryl diester phosphodiesterase
VLRSTADELATRGIPRLEEILDAWAGRGRMIIEIKNQPGQPDFDAPREQTARLLTDVLRARGLTGPPPGERLAVPGTVTVSSFDWHAIEVIRDAGTGIGTAFLTMPRMSVAAGLAYVRMAGHAELHAHVSSVLGNGDAAGRARQAGIRLVTWTVTSTEMAHQLRDADVDGAICDDPAEVVRAVRQ